jgi:DNA-binding GntR family transcriptional regulator
MIQRPEPTRLAVQDAIRDLIIQHVYEPGQHIGEHKLASLLGATRHPVREALQALATEGWVDLEVDRGAFVHRPTQQEVGEAFRVRGALEAEGVRGAAARANASDVAELHRLVQRGRERLAAGNTPGLVEANAQFHRFLAELSGNRLLTELLTSLDLRIRWYFSSVAQIRGVDSWDEHDAIVTAIADGDAERAALLMRAHSLNTESVYLGTQGDDASTTQQDRTADSSRGRS